MNKAIFNDLARAKEPTFGSFSASALGGRDDLPGCSVDGSRHCKPAHATCAQRLVFASVERQHQPAESMHQRTWLMGHNPLNRGQT
jgi:hypothetical protein